VPAVGEDPGVVAVVEDLERSLISPPQLGDEPVVPERAEELPRARSDASAIRSGERMSLHTRIIDLDPGSGNLVAS
jgi:hypothetical protein